MHFETILKLILEQGSYDVPEVSQVEISEGNKEYLSWVENETSKREL